MGEGVEFTNANKMINQHYESPGCERLTPFVFSSLNGVLVELQRAPFGVAFFQSVLGLHNTPASSLTLTSSRKRRENIQEVTVEEEEEDAREPNANFCIHSFSPLLLRHQALCQ